ncbi:MULTISPECIES: acyltransferase domain-containing protein [unclassified Paenibacillus]|uniref:acyltransferase domain-containing protein n=1 Tax=unclassified Paenibacillus TaxID=185978 RepID=UPI002405E0AA|nr:MULTISPECIES: acyltransferase domain-containing protein [unclassified Paenibacillus]
MNLQEVCDCICLPDQIKITVLNFANRFDEKTVEPYSAALYDRSTREKAVKDIAEVLGDDPDGSKMLTFMLLRAAEAHKEYGKRGISETIFTDTMKFCTRFVEEHYKVHGTYAFVWGWWFPRQLSLHEFRIGALEYEMIENEDKKLINIHIPADADMRRESLRKSYEDARVFFAKYYPEYGQSDMVCSSWLLSPALAELLPENSNIVCFQKAFDLTRIDETKDSAIRWVYGRTDLPIHDLPERTSLQKKIKARMLEGGIIGAADGKLLADPWNTLQEF